MANIYFGIDIGGTEVKFGMFLNDRVIDKFSIATPTENVKEKLINNIYENILIRLDQQSYSLNDLEGIGITVPGPVDGDIVVYCANVNLEENFNIVKAVKEKFKKKTLKVTVGNDADLAAYGEYKYFNEPGLENVVLITLGTGVGSGVIVNGKLVDGDHGCAGEIGHMPMDFEESYPCGCGKKGCLETIAGTQGLIRLAEKHMKKNKKSTMRKFEITPKLIFDHAKNGDLAALKTVDDMAEAIARAAATVAVVIDPELFIIGGGISNAGNFLLSKINYHYQKLARFQTKKARFILARLGNDAGFYGAYYFVRDS